MNRKIFIWKLRSTELQLGEKTLVMGVLNVTPDSFSDGGKYSDPDRAYARALELEEQGADIIDLGAESTSPGSHRVSAEEEWSRLLPVLKRLRGNLSVPLSLDTYKAETAQRAFDYGIEIINDPSGLTFDSELARTVVQADAGLILNHMRGTPETWAKLPPLPDIMGSVVRDLEATVNRARRAGVDKARIAVDPGLGFGKRREQNSEILAQLQQLAALEYPVLTGPSRKSFLAQGTEHGTLYATAAAVTASILNGAHMVRVHDVKEMRVAAQIADDVLRASQLKVVAAPAPPERVVPRRPVREVEDRPRALKPPVAAKIVPAPAPSSVEAEATTSMVPEPRPIEPRDSRAPREEYSDRPARKEFGDRPPRKDFGDRPPRREFNDRPPRKDFGDRPPRKDFGDRPPRKEFGDRPPRRDFGDRPPRKEFGDRPARREFTDRPPRKVFGDKPPRKDFGDRPPRRDFSDRPPRKEFGDKPPRKDFSGRPPRKDFGDRPPRKDFGDRPPRRNFGDKPPRKDAGPPRGKGGPADRRPRPFRKRP